MKTRFGAFDSFSDRLPCLGGFFQFAPCQPMPSRSNSVSVTIAITIRIRIRPPVSLQNWWRRKPGGQIKVAIYPRNQLGSNRELLEQVKMGSLEMTLLGLGTMGYMVEEYNFMQIPFRLQEPGAHPQVLDGEVGKTIEKAVGSKGFVLLNQKWDRLPRHLAGKKPVQKMEDLKGMKIREGTPAFHEGIKLYGASPVKVDLNEMYIALQQGVVDAVELAAGLCLSITASTRRPSSSH